MMSRKAWWCWGGLLSLALAIRLAALNVTPLAPAEVALALPSWDAARGAGWPASAESPLLLVGNMLLFTLFGPGNGMARLLPALAGVGLAALMLPWRKYLGEAGALVAAGLLALSPIALFASRHADGASVSVFAALLLFTGVRFSADPERQARATGWQSAGIAVGLVSGPVFYDALLAGLVAWLAYRWGTGARSRPALDSLGKVLLWGLVGAWLLATGLGLRWSGWAGPVESLLAWLSQWSGQVGGAGPLLLGLYEPLTVLLAAAALGWAVFIGEPLALALGFSALLTTLVLALRPGADSLALTAAVVPLALLGGQLAQSLWSRRRSFALLGEGAQALLTLIFWVFAGLALARHASYSATGVELYLVLLVALIQLFLVGTLALFVNREAAWRGFLLGTAATLLVVQVSFAWGVAFVRAADPAEPLVGAATSPDVDNLRATLQELQYQAHLSSDALEIAVLDTTPALTPTIRWALRDLPRLRVVAGWAAGLPDYVVAPEDAPSSNAQTDAWRGVAFRVTLSAERPALGCTTFSPLMCQAPVRWYLYRQAPNTSQAQRVILWVAAP